MLCRSRKRQSELRLVLIRRLRSSATVSTKVRSGCWAISSAAQASAYRRTTEASTDHRATDASTHPAVKASTKAVPTTHTMSTGHSTAVSTSTVSAPAMSTTTTSVTADRSASGRKPSHKTQ
jgi:hypothetical protein